MAFFRTLSLSFLLLLPVVVSAESTVVFNGGRTELSDEEIEQFGFKATFEQPSGSKEGLLTITVPDTMAGSDLDRVSAVLYDGEPGTTEFEPAVSQDTAGDRVIQIRVDPDVVVRVKLRLRYAASSKYELVVDLRALQYVEYFPPV